MSVGPTGGTSVKTGLGTLRGIWDTAVPVPRPGLWRAVREAEAGALVLRAVCSGAVGPSKVRYSAGCAGQMSTRKFPLSRFQPARWGK